MPFKRILTIALLVISANAFSQWNLFTTLPTTPTTQLIDIDYTTEYKGAYCRQDYMSPSSGNYWNVFASNDGGLNWSSTFNSQGPGVSANAVFAVKNTSTFYYIHNYQGFYRLTESLDYGNTWTQIANGQGYASGFSAVDTTHQYYIFSWGGSTLHKRVRGVVTNNIYTFPGNEYPHDMQFTDTMVGYITAATSIYQPNHFILKSVNSGAAWTTIFTDTSFYINKVFFVNASVGYAVGKTGKMIKTTDGGQNWQSLNPGTTKNLRSTYFINDSVGYIVGDSGLIKNTLDGGTTWIDQSVGSLYGFKKIFFVNDSVGFALAGAYLFKLNSTIVIGLKENETVQEGSSVYPNPNCGLFVFESRQLNSTIELEDRMGKVILNTEKTSIKMSIDMSGFASGVYFLKEKLNGKVISRKKIVYSGL